MSTSCDGAARAALKDKSNDYKMLNLTRNHYLLQIGDVGVQNAVFDDTLLDDIEMLQFEKVAANKQTTNFEQQLENLKNLY